MMDEIHNSRWRSAIDEAIIADHDEPIPLAAETFLEVEAELGRLHNLVGERWGKLGALVGFPSFFAGILIGGCIVQGFREQDHHHAPATPVHQSGAQGGHRPHGRPA